MTTYQQTPTVTTRVRLRPWAWLLVTVGVCW